MKSGIVSTASLSFSQTVEHPKARASNGIRVDADRSAGLFRIESAKLCGGSLLRQVPVREM